MLVAHRGFRTKDGENRMVDFEKALFYCKAVEFDIRLTKDKEIIIFHDHNFTRIGNTKDRVKSLTYEQIKNIDFFKKNPDYLPPLFIKDFVNNLSERYVMINVEIKPDRYDKYDFLLIKDALLNLREKTQAEIIVSSFGTSCLEFIKKLPNNFKKGYLSESLGKINYELLKDFDYLNLCISTLKQKNNIELIKKINMPLNIWTFKNNNEARLMIEYYGKEIIHGFISDIPDLDINI